MDKRKIISFIFLLGFIVVLFTLYKRTSKLKQTVSILPGEQYSDTVPTGSNTILSVFENLKVNYRFAYPQEFQINNISDNQVEIVAPSGKGKITIQIEDKSFETKIIEDHLTQEESIILQETKDIVKDTFEFISQKYSEKELQERFMSSTPSSTLGN